MTPRIRERGEFLRVAGLWDCSFGATLLGGRLQALQAMARGAPDSLPISSLHLHTRTFQPALPSAHHARMRHCGMARGHLGLCSPRSLSSALTAGLPDWLPRELQGGVECTAREVLGRTARACEATPFSRTLRSGSMRVVIAPSASCGYVVETIR